MISDIEKKLIREFYESVDLIEQKKSDQVQGKISALVEQSPEIVDERFQLEVCLLLKIMESREALREFEFLRSISLMYRYLESRYIDIGRNINYSAETGDLLPEADTIWWCWLQGYDNAPEIVKKCFNSLEKLEKKVIVLSEENINEYISLPDYIQQKYKSGVISKTHYSDIVRMELLTKNGGIWMDSTALITGKEKIAPLIEQEDLFMYRAGNVSEYIIFDSWFMMSKKRSNLLESTKNMLLAYWKEEDSLKHYFLVNMLMTIACRLYQDEFKRIPTFSNEPCHILQYELFDKYAHKRWIQIKDMSDVHKLTYKFDRTDTADTFLEYIMTKDI